MPVGFYQEQVGAVFVFRGINFMNVFYNNGRWFFCDNRYQVTPLIMMITAAANSTPVSAHGTWMQVFIWYRTFSVAVYIEDSSRLPSLPAPVPEYLSSDPPGCSSKRQIQIALLWFPGIGCTSSRKACRSLSVIVPAKPGAYFTILDLLLKP